MKKSIVQTLALSLSAAMVIGITGCSKVEDEIAKAGLEDTTVTGKAVDGYLRGAAVCLDLDGNDICSPFEPNTLTELDGSYSFNVTPDHKIHDGYEDANLIVFGGKDSDTGKDFFGKLVSAFDETDPTNVFITPLTTMVAAIIETSDDSGLTKAEAEQEVATMLGLTQAQVNSDPVAAAEAGDTAVLSKALELHKAVEVLAATNTTASSKEATDNVYLALAEGSKNSTSADTTVADMLNNVDTAILGTEATAVLSAAVVLAENVALAVTNMETNATDTKLAIAAVANTVDNVKELLDAEVEAYATAVAADSTATYTSAVTTSAAEDVSNKVTSDKVENVIVQNVVTNTVNITFTDEQLALILAQMGENSEITLESVGEALTLAAEDNEGLAAVEANITAEVEKEEAEHALLDSIDTTITTESVLTGTGIFELRENHDDGQVTFSPTKMKIVEGVFTNFDLNETTGLFDIESDDGDREDYIELVNGSWVVQTGSSDMPEAQFDASGNLIIDDGYEHAMYSVSGFDAEGISINNIVRLGIEGEKDPGDSEGPIDWLKGVNLDGNFSEGAMYYRILATTLEGDNTGFEPRYEMWINEYTWENDREIATPGINQNYERYHDQSGEHNITTLSEFMIVHDANGTNPINFWNRDQEHVGYLAEDGVLALYRNERRYDSSLGYETSVEIPLDENGTYRMEDVDGVDILVVEVPESIQDEWMRGRAHNIFAVQDGAVRRGQVQYTSYDGKQESGEFNVYNEIAILDIWNAIKDANITMTFEYDMGGDDFDPSNMTPEMAIVFDILENGFGGEGSEPTMDGNIITFSTDLEFTISEDNTTAAGTFNNYDLTAVIGSGEGFESVSFDDGTNSGTITFNMYGDPESATVNGETFSLANDGGSEDTSSYDDNTTSNSYDDNTTSNDDNMTEPSYMDVTADEFSGKTFTFVDASSGDNIGTFAFNADGSYTVDGGLQTIETDGVTVNAGWEVGQDTDAPVSYLGLQAQEKALMKRADGSYDVYIFGEETPDSTITLTEVI